VRRQVNRSPVGIVLAVEGSTVVGRDVDEAGDRSCIRQTLMETQSPEHAEITAAILADPRLMVYMASGFFTQEKLDSMAEQLRRQRCVPTT